MRTLLFDADAIAYRAAAGDQRNYDWGDGVVSVAADLEEAKKIARDEIDAVMAALEADALVICLSDDLHNFRKEIDPTYKASRATVERPVYLYDLKAWLGEAYPSRLMPRLEADDVMGILSTEPAPGEDRIVVSQDKDLLGVPGLLYRPYSPDPSVEAVSPEEADRWHLIQTLAGDPVDEYPGCPGIGPVRAAQFLDSGTGVEAYQHVITRGPRAGVPETRWHTRPMARPWDIVVSLYAKAGLTEAVALRQARLARILRHGERPGSWEPA